METTNEPRHCVLPKASEAVAIYKEGPWRFVIGFGLAGVFAAVDVICAILGHPELLLFYGPMALLFGFGTALACLRVELYRDGQLVMHFLARRSMAITVGAVSGVDRDVENGSWTVSFEGGTFTMSSNRSAASLVHALMRRKPTIALSGYALPAL